MIGESGQIQGDWLKATATILRRDDNDIDQVGTGGGGDKCSNSAYIF